MKNRMLVALLIEYKRAMLPLKSILSDLSESQFLEIRDFKTTDPDCKSIATVINHCVHSGYLYASYLDTITKDSTWIEYEKTINNPIEAIKELDKMVDYTEAILKKISHLTDKELNTHQLKARWGVTFDVEQLLEHAIVHILRHRLQIENFLKA
ncbi:DinB family protein [Olleya sp. YS]|uniref:DinB family protein n=1 Tax=Olleya sp. YS TaxID=3028318 RepID=UPI0024344B81|nr:DinB family protein [Olleya sp. YS]WGD34218.1 DinB family protein [Olleya sp. YS]